ncbi:MAG: radical SAM family heme chaperone HemW [Actinomycetota bacterium]|nr:radical SAM family heme chaperone HemW [Actinomycetota bacterium]
MSTTLSQLSLPGRAAPDHRASPDQRWLPESARRGLLETPFGLYIHVPFCASRCGYCDFNTYTAAELGPGASQNDYVDSVLAELRLVRHILGPELPTVRTVFFGGGTPTLLPAEHLAAMLEEIRAEFPVAPDVEITVEANPESVTRASFARLARAGVNRVSLGMQSAVPHVLAVLDRRHTPGQALLAAEDARAAGIDRVSLDLIYGTPGESDADWQASLDAALSAGVEHLSAYALIVEPGTALARRVGSGQIQAPDDDVLADRYEQTDHTLKAAGLDWYEVSNWTSAATGRCRHNELYWAGGNWWGIGPGAHSHIGGARWWNLKHPAAYARALSAAGSPAQGSELLDPEQRKVEAIMLGIRLRDGVALQVLSERGQQRAGEAVTYGLLDRGAYADGRAALTLRGRLLADAVVRDLTD